MKQLLRGLALGLLVHPLAQAGVINFDDLVHANFDPIAGNYADHGLNGNGDARVGVAYSGSDGADNHLLFWNDLYGPLLKVALTPTDGTSARITLSADPGWLIQSIAFDLAAWPMIDLAFWPAVDILADVHYTLGGLVVDAPGTLVLGKTAPHLNHFALSDPTGAAQATIRWGTDYDVGIDNIHFSVVRDPAVPLPAPGTLPLLGLAGAALLARRRR